MSGRLTPAEKHQIQQLYEDRLTRLGADVRAVGWGSRESQVLRFEVLVRGVDLRGRHILDVGCGLGDLVPFLNTRSGGDFMYTGIDIAPRMVAEAERIHQGPGRRFIVGDILEMDRLEPVDVVLSSGALTLRVEDNMAFAKAMIGRMVKLGREVVSINFMSSYVDYQLEKDFHYSPELLFSHARGLTRWVTLYHDYPLWEFTLQLRTAATGGDLYPPGSHVLNE